MKKKDLNREKGMKMAVLGEKKRKDENHQQEILAQALLPLHQSRLLMRMIVPKEILKKKEETLKILLTRFHDHPREKKEKRPKILEGKRRKKIGEEGKRTVQ